MIVLDTNDPEESIEFANRFGHSYRQLQEMAKGSGDGRSGNGMGGEWGANYHHYTDKIEVSLHSAEGAHARDHSQEVRKKKEEDARARRKMQEEAEVVAKSLPWFLRASSVTGLDSMSAWKEGSEQAASQEREERERKKKKQRERKLSSAGISAVASDSSSDPVAAARLEERKRYSRFYLEKYNLQYSSKNS